MARKRVTDDKMFRVKETGLAVMRLCVECDFYDVRKKIVGGGRGSGFREGNKQRGRMIQHFKAAHPKIYTAHKEETERW
jgi:hypothetical protein